MLSSSVIYSEMMKKNHRVLLLKMTYKDIFLLNWASALFWDVKGHLKRKKQFFSWSSSLLSPEKQNDLKSSFLIADFFFIQCCLPHIKSPCSCWRICWGGYKCTGRIANIWAVSISQSKTPPDDILKAGLNIKDVKFTSEEQH